MPRRNNQAPPKVMTWGKAAPVLIVAIIFDAIRFMCEWLVFFGPALAAVYCTAKVNGILTTWTVGLLGAKTAALACGSGAVVAGVVGAVAIETTGIILAMAVGFAGWLIIGGWLMATNTRIFKENALWFVGSLLLSEIPFVNSIPAFTIVIWKMYRTQIRVEKGALARYEASQAAEQARERNQQITQINQMRAAQQIQAANDEQYAVAEEAANAAQYIPDEMRKAA